MKKILIVSTVSRQFYLFEQGNIEVMKSLGYEVHCAANFSDESERLISLKIIRQPIDIQRHPFSIRNIKAYFQLKRIMKQEKFDIVHCHSPVGGVLARLAAKSLGISRIIYTAHGFHFYKGSPLLNWLLFYPIEKWLSHYTKVIITINKEDYERAKKFSANKVVFVPGVGVDIRSFSNNIRNREKKRIELNIKSKDIVLLSVGELNRNKNHQMIIKAMALLGNSNVKYIICGKGDLEKKLLKQAKELNLDSRVSLLGFRNDVSEILSVADVYVFPSFREGLSLALMEAMAAGLPVVCSDIRGNRDLIENGKGGFLFAPNNLDDLVRSLSFLIENETSRHRIGQYNRLIIENYDTSLIKCCMKKVYQEVIMN